jgi:anti-anti-sigma factor
VTLANRDDLGLTQPASRSTVADDRLYRADEMAAAGELAARLTVGPLADRPGLRLVGEVDVTTRYELESALRTLVERREDVSVDMREVDFIDVGGVSLLVDVARRLVPGQRLLLYHTPYQLRRLVELLWRRPPAGMELDGP